MNQHRNQRSRIDLQELGREVVAPLEIDVMVFPPQAFLGQNLSDGFARMLPVSIHENARAGMWLGLHHSPQQSALWQVEHCRQFLERKWR